MTIELCPQCRVPRNLAASIAKREEKDPDGRTRLVETRTLRCETCGTFVRSEEIGPDPRT